MRVPGAVRRAWERFWERHRDSDPYAYAYLDWWEAEGQDAVLRRLAEVWTGPDEASRRAAWFAVDAIGECGAFGGVTEEEIAEYLADWAEDEGAGTTPERDAAAARAVRAWLDEHEPGYDDVPGRP